MIAALTGRRTRALLAALTIAAIVVGVPSVLAAVGAGGVPESFRGWDRLWTALTSPDDGTLLLALLQVVAWLCWAVLTLTFAVELASRVRGLPAPRLPALAAPQGLARSLVGAVAAAFLAVQPAAATEADPVSTAATWVSTATGDHAGPESSGPVSMVGTPVAAAAVAVPAAPPAGTRPAPALVTHTVRPGESLWRIAEAYLSDGTRFGEIADLNYGRQQADGETLTDTHWINPGWQLLVPDERHAAGGVSDRAQPPADDSSVRQHQVRPGESLWDVAVTELGDGHRWRELHAASRALVQPDGSRLRDPDLIRPGWTVAVPDDPGPQVRRDEVGGGRSTPGVSAEAAAATQVPAVAADRAEDGDSGTAADQGEHGLDDTAPWPIRTTGGVGALLAAGVITTLGARRRLQSLRRLPHELPDAVPDEVAWVERELRAVADPLGVHSVDLLLRGLARSCRDAGAAPPALRIARLSPERLELYLEEPADLPLPWAAHPDAPDGLVWELATDDAPVLPDRELADIPAPYPALVTLGHDDEAHLLGDLERLGVLDLDGPEELSRSVMSALAVELATSSWADDVRVTLVGDFVTVEDSLATGRLRYVPVLADALDELSVRAEADHATLTAAGLDPYQARVQGAVPTTWAPEVLLVATSLTADQADRLADLARRRPRAAWAAVTLASGAGRWTLRLLDRTSARLDPADLALRPQLLDDETRGLVQLLVALADPDLRRGRAPDPAGAVPDHVDPAVLDPAVLDPAVLDPAVLDPEVAPVVRVLGTVQIDGSRGQVEPSKRSRLSELIAFLALHPGVGHRQIDEAIWPGRRHEDNLNTRNTATSKARAWLGRSTDGEDFLPRHASGVGYALSSRVRTDWSLWCDLVGDSPATASTRHLEEALRLVRGRPFEGVHPRRYAWADTLRQRMTTQIVDASYELARRGLLAGRWHGADTATAVGLLVEPAWEPLWRLRIMAAHEARNPSAVQEAVARLLAVTDALDSDLAPATLALLAAVAGDRGSVTALCAQEIG